MKITIITLAVILVLILLYLAYQGHLSKSGAAAGLADGRLTPCPGKPNCVCSEYPQDSNHAIEPIVLQGASVAVAMDRLKGIIEVQGGRVVSEREDYLAATFTSRLFGFVDDLELRSDPEAGVIHLRSASRVGTSDFGVNGRRVDDIRKAFREALSLMDPGSGPG